MLDADLAVLYGVRPKALNQAVKRNTERFPADFCFQLTAKEWADLKSRIGGTLAHAIGNRASAQNWSQFVTSSMRHRGATYRPYTFTEQGVAMLSSVL
ncbi:MAG: hypothetical protein DME90_08525 [Verrucomicrobia bacterium]|nr:MAG: hypothetical protein DME90_08525 [Verrucomicrobiota bacterium]